MSSGGGSKTTTQNSTSTVELPSWLEGAAQKNIARAQQVADIGYTPYYGLDVAGFSPMQTSAMQNTANAASAFGLAAPTDVMAGMPKTTTNNLGFTGYSSGDMFDTALAQLAANRPAQYLAIQQQFTDPVTGVASVPTAMDVLTNPDSTDAQIQALYGTVTDSDRMGTSDPSIDGDTRTALEKYQDSLKWLAGDAGWIQDNIGKAGLIGTGLSKLADLASENYVENYLGSYIPFMNEGEYGLMTDANGNYQTSNKALADRMGWEYYQPVTVSPISPSGNFSWSGGTNGGGSYNWGSASQASRRSSALDSGTGSGIGSGGGNASRGFSTGGW